MLQHVYPYMQRRKGTLLGPFLWAFVVLEVHELQITSVNNVTGVVFLVIVTYRDHH